MNIPQNIVTSYAATANVIASEPSNVDLPSEPSSKLGRSNADIVSLNQQTLTAEDMTYYAKQLQNTEAKSKINSENAPNEKIDKSLFSDWSRVNQDKAYTIEQLKTNWLAESEHMVEKYYGLKAQGDNTLYVRFNDQSDVDYLASISYSPEEDDKLSRTTNQVLTLVTSHFPQGQGENGGYKPFYGDRIVAHEMTHAIMGQTMDMDSLGQWFKEGAAELLQGGDERILYQLSGLDGDLENGYNNQDIANFSNDIQIFDHWNGSSKQYAQSYTAVRFMHQDIVSNGGEGIKDVMTFLTDEKMLATRSATIDNALAYLAYQGLSSYASEAEFKNAFQQQAATYISNMELTNDDTGAIGGYDVDKGEIKTAESVVNNTTKSSAANPLKGYKEIVFPDAPNSTFSAYS